jgi:hypothetical protein
MKRTFALISAIAAAGIVATVGSAMLSKPGGALHVTKECSEYNGSVGSFCTITSSNIDAIEPGMKVVYLAAPANGVLDSDIVLSFGQGDAALGHVVLDLTRAKGRVAFSGGTGRFAGFRAHAHVSVDSTGQWHWDGAYSFTRSGDDD